MTLLLVLAISQSAFQIRACVSIPTTSTTTDIVQEDAVLDTTEPTAIVATSPQASALIQLNQRMRSPNTTISNNNILAESHLNITIPTKKLISAKQANLTFEEWKVDNKMEKLLGIERPVMPILVKKTTKENPKVGPKDISLLFSDPSWKLKIAPAVSWTYCNPACGSGDQAIDLENAFENAHADVLSGQDCALFHPQTGDTTLIDEYSVKASISITSNYVLSAYLWNKISTTFASFLRRERHVHFYSPPKMTSYKNSNVSFSLLI
uniref:Uncharacterized protein n=1 Tax=Ditylenchus dipsaci TaxID=166011 RepID=A0A915D975_9BILA